MYYFTLLSLSLYLGNHVLKVEMKKLYYVWQLIINSYLIAM